MPGIPEIPEAVFEELLVNALIHRDYLVSAPIRLFIFDDRIEIISPGHLPDNLTVEKIRAGISNIRNPILVSYTAKGLLPYHGLGSGIKRALSLWPKIEFKDDRDACLFTSTIYRDTQNSISGSEKSSEKSSEKTDVLILENLAQHPQMTIKDLSEILGISTRAVEKQLSKLKETGKIERTGSRKQGCWKIIK